MKHQEYLAHCGSIDDPLSEAIVAAAGLSGSNFVANSPLRQDAISLGKSMTDQAVAHTVIPLPAHAVSWSASPATMAVLKRPPTTHHQLLATARPFLPGRPAPFFSDITHRYHRPSSVASESPFSLMPFTPMTPITPLTPLTPGTPCSMDHSGSSPPAFSGAFPPAFLGDNEDDGYFNHRWSNPYLAWESPKPKPHWETKVKTEHATHPTLAAITPAQRTLNPRAEAYLPRNPPAITPPPVDNVSDTHRASTDPEPTTPSPSYIPLPSRPLKFRPHYKKQQPAQPRGPPRGNFNPPRMNNTQHRKNTAPTARLNGHPDPRALSASTIPA